MSKQKKYCFLLTLNVNVFIKKCLGLGIVSAGIAYGVDFLMAKESSQGIPIAFYRKIKR
ncbi:MAG TPA: hypothetical protein VF350_06810 [Candidatus Bathyarchaeia archaeon]